MRSKSIFPNGPVVTSCTPEPLSRAATWSRRAAACSTPSAPAPTWPPPARPPTRWRNACRCAAAGTDMTSRRERQQPPDLPLRVSTIELFFDLVFVFTITQLTSMLARDMSFAAAGRVLLIFGLLWWMYGGYAWLTNARTPSRVQERLLILLGMAGFLVIGLSIPQAFGSGGARGQ